jgi:hypothetical protein
VKNSASFLSSLLARPPEGRVRDFLADLFSIDVSDEPMHDTDRIHLPIPAAAGETGNGERAASDGASIGISIARIAGGFTIKASAPQLIDRPLHGEVAYRLRAGNPFRKHSAFDFDLTSDAISINAEGVRLRATSVNAFELLPLAAKFQLSMKGFDPRRDLVVRLIDAGDASQTELH